MKRFLYLLCALAFCLALTPSTALAADEFELYVSGQQITQSGCYENQNGTWTKVDGAEPAAGQFCYDAVNSALTLNGTTISHNQSVVVGSGAIRLGSLIAYSQSADVSLHLVLQGDNSITGTGGIRVDSTTGNASLSISGPGSLTADVGGYIDSGITLIGSKAANLNIDGADVTASSNVYGVELQAGEGYVATATINDGNLTASGLSVGIYYGRPFDVTTGGPSSLTVSGNAVVDTEGGIKGIYSSSLNSFQVGADGESGGIVWDGNTGTVYGDVTLQDDLTINENETLTIGTDASLTIPDGKTLTNNGTITNDGTINIQNGGNLSGAPIGGTVVHAPGITTESLPNGTVGTPYTANLEATGDSIEWSATGLPAGLQINAATGVISGTPTAAGNFTFTVTAKNSAGEASKEYTLAIEAVPVANVTLDHSVLALFPGDTTALTATVEPDTATDKTVTWESSDPNVATVDQSGKVTAVAPGTATITATAGGQKATCTVTVTDRTYTVSVNPTSLEFDTICPGDARPDAKTVTITNTGNQTVEVTLPTATGYTITGDEGFTGNTASIEPEGTATFTVQPNDLTSGNHSETLTISWNNGNLSLPVGFTVGHELTGVAAKAPTCTEDGYEAYWKCERCNELFSDADGKTPIPAPTVIKATGHQWGEPAWSWDGTTATATFTCAECGETRTVDATVTPTATTDPTCTGNGTTTYTATATLDGKDYTATKNITIPATGHDWGEPAWTWGEDGKTATATFTCKNDNSHTDIVTAAVTSTVKTDPTCTENGVTEYTATVEHDGTTYTATKNVADIPATGHEWGEDGHCTICDAVKPGFTPEIIQGDEATWTKGDGQPLSFTSNAAYADFQEARVDGRTLDPVHYTVERGSTIVTLKAAYLESLDPGEHTLDIVSSTGTATATFTITAKETQQPADTQQPAKPADTDRTPAKSAGDGGQLSRGGSDIMPAVATLAILMASGLVLGTFVLRRGRR